MEDKNIYFFYSIIIINSIIIKILPINYNKKK